MEAGLNIALRSRGNVMAVDNLLGLQQRGVAVFKAAQVVDLRHQHLFGQEEVFFQAECVFVGIHTV